RRRRTRRAPRRAAASSPGRSWLLRREPWGSFPQVIAVIGVNEQRGGAVSEGCVSAAVGGRAVAGGYPDPLGALHSSVLHHAADVRGVPDVASSGRRPPRDEPPRDAVTSHNSTACAPGTGAIVGSGPHSGARAHRPPTRCRPRARERFAVIDALQGSPLLTLFLVVATGALLSGLASSAIAPRLVAGMESVQTLGLALFVYSVGISAGATFFGSLNRQLPLLAAATVSTVLAAALTLVLGHGLGLARDLS